MTHRGMKLIPVYSQFLIPVYMIHPRWTRDETHRGVTFISVFQTAVKSHRGMEIQCNARVLNVWRQNGAFSYVEGGHLTSNLSMQWHLTSTRFIHVKRMRISSRDEFHPAVSHLGSHVKGALKAANPDQNPKLIIKTKYPVPVIPPNRYGKYLETKNNRSHFQRIAFILFWIIAQESDWIDF